MRVAIVAPSSVPFVLGGAERLWNGLTHAINESTPHDCELIKLPSREHNLVDLMATYEAFAALDLSHFDLVISTKYPAWMVSHPNHIVYLQHTLRGLYDTYPRQLSTVPSAREPAVADLLSLVALGPERRLLPELFARFGHAVASLGPSHEAFAFPGPLARHLVHHLDRMALSPGAIARHLAISATVAARPGYFPAGVSVEAVPHPSDLESFACRGFDHFFTASRLDSTKRVHLLVEAMRYVPQDVPLRIAGTGPESDRLRELAADDPRIEFLGYVATDELVGLYADALAVPFVPLDEDLGLITLEAMCSGKPVLTTRDAGGPTELVVNGVNGFVTAPDPPLLGRALATLAADPASARRMGEAARRTGARVTWERTVAALLRPGRPSGSGSQAAARSTARRGGRARLVVLSTFPVHPRLGGGQLRCFHLYGALTDRFDVEIVSLGGPHDEQVRIDLGPGFTETVVPKSVEHEAREAAISSRVGVPVTDIVAPDLISCTPAYLDELRGTCEGAEAVLLAHPFMLPALDLVGVDLPIVYDAHNAEARLKGTILPDTADGRALLERVRHVEGEATRRATLVSVCSSEDADALMADYGIDDARLLPVPNGVDDRAVAFSTPDVRGRNRDRWLARFKDLGGVSQPRHIAVFAGSWHPPNIDAAEHIIEMAPEIPEVLFLLIGGHGDWFGRWFRTPDNVVRMGIVSESHKQALLASADLALNPMTRGSGTNLKIVEYFAAGVPVVSTPLGARGLSVEADVHLSVAELETFVAAIRQLLAEPTRGHHLAFRARQVVEDHYSWRRLASGLGDAIAPLARLGART